MLPESAFSGAGCPSRVTEPVSWVSHFPRRVAEQTLDQRRHVNRPNVPIVIPLGACRIWLASSLF
jgi:hypothetical protein